MYKILTFGEILKDVRLDESGNTLSADTAGLTVNVAAYARLLGEQASIVMKVGDDEWGKEIIKEVEDLGIEIIFTTEKFGQATDAALIKMKENGQPEFLKFIWSSLPSIREEDVKEEWLKGIDIVQIGAAVGAFEGSKKAGQKLVGLAKKDNKLVSFDLNLRKSIFNNGQERYRNAKSMITQADIVKMSAAELLFFSHLDAIREIKNEVSLSELVEIGQKLNERYGKKLLLITLGGFGALAFSKEDWAWASSYDYGGVKNSIGAGDCFFAAALQKYFEGNNLLEILDHASQIAGISVTGERTITTEVRNHKSLEGKIRYKSFEEAEQSYRPQSKSDLSDFKELL